MRSNGTEGLSASKLPKKPPISRGPEEQARERYTQEEQVYSQHLKRQQDELLNGKRHELQVCRLFHQGAQTLIEIYPPKHVEASRMGYEPVKKMITATLSFFVPEGTDGGIIEQRTHGEHTVQIQPFPTRFPHITLECSDVYEKDAQTPSHTTYVLKRMQNHNEHRPYNRMLDLGNIAFSILQALVS